MFKTLQQSPYRYIQLKVILLGVIKLNQYEPKLKFLNNF
jgi:hypothetical protein